MDEAIKINIDVTRLDKTAFFKGKNGTYCSLIIWPNRDGEDQYGNTSTVKQDMGKDRREEKTQIIGNGKPLRKRSVQSSPPPKNYEKLPTKQEAGDEDDIPF